MRICKGIALSFCIVLFVFPFISFASGEVSLTTFSGGTDIPADTAGVGGSGVYTKLTDFSIAEGGVGNIKSGTVTITAPTGFEFDTTNPATVTVTSSTGNSATNINHLNSGDFIPSVTTANSIYFTITSQSTSARNTLTWGSVWVRPVAIASITNSDIMLSSTDSIVGLALPMSVGVVSELYIPPTISSINITTPATKLVYKVGDTLDITGLVVTGTYSDGSTKTENITQTNITGFDSSLPVKGQIVTIDVSGKTTTYSVDIETPAPIVTNIKDINIISDVVWKKENSPYIIGRNVSVSGNGKLTIEAGTTVVFNSEIKVNGGKVYVNGTKANPVNISGTQVPYTSSVGFNVTNEGELYTEWMSCKTFHICVLLLRGGKIYINHSDFSDMNNGIAYGEYGVLDVQNTYFRNGRFGISGNFGTSGNPFEKFTGNSAFIHATYNYFDGMYQGGYFQYSTKQGLVNVNFKVENNTFKTNNTVGAVFGGNSIVGDYTVGANYYGDPSGPHSDANPTSKGAQIYYGTKTIISPWLTTEVFPGDGDVVIKPVLPECCSSVMFFPGIEGSRLYMKNSLGIEDQLWEPNTASDVADLYANTDGNSINDVYTRDIIKETNLVGNAPFLRRQIYKAFSDDLDNLVNTDKIHEWQPVPYDWRMSVDDIVDGGVVLENETKNIITELERMVHDSDTGKVSLVGHSNGGLLIKYLVKKLEDKGEADLLDNVVLVGSPELGTPQGLVALLHGLDFDGLFGVLAPRKYNRELALNIPGAYSLIPSSKSFKNNTTPIISFDNSIGDFAGIINGYGNSIDTYKELKDFILSTSDDRTIPDFDNINIPAMGNESLYNKAENLHSIIDNYTIPSFIKIYEISGTGLPTVSGIKYSRNTHCLLDVCTDRQFLVPEITTTVDGDKVVLNSSSAVLPGTRYYVDMNSYNKDNNVNFDHAYMLQNNSIKKLVENIVTGVDEPIPYVIEKNSLPTIKTKHISMHSPVNIDVYDQQGRHTGPCVDPDYPDMDCVEQEIPNSSYMALGEDKYITIPNEGTYTLKLDGYDTGTFTLNIDNYENDNKTDSVEFKDVPITTDTSSTVDLTTLPQEILLDNNNDNEPDLKINSNSEVIDLHPKKENTEIVVVKPIVQGGKPILDTEKVKTTDMQQNVNKTVAVRTRSKNVIIKKPVQFVNKQINTNTNTVAAPTDSIETNIMPMSANVGDSVNFDLWKFIKRLFNY